MDLFFVSLLNGIVYGLLLFMVSSGLTVIFGMLSVLNFAHASFYMLGAYTGFIVTRYIGFWPGIAVGTFTVALVGWTVERGLLRHVRRFGHTQELLLTFGLFFVIEEIIKLLFGPFPVAYRVPEELRFTAFQIGDAPYPFYRVLIAGVSLAIFAGIYGILGLTRIGTIVRAAVQRPQMVSALGHNVQALFSAMFAVGAGLAGLAGAIGGAFYPTSPNMAGELGAIVFVVVVVGGLGSLNGALAASLLIGCVTSFAVAVDASPADILAAFGIGDASSATGILAVPLSSMAGVLPYALMLLILLVRPSGLFRKGV